MSVLLRHLRHHAVAYVALFVALGGTSYAAATLRSNSVGTRQLRPGAVGASDIRAGAVTSRAIRNGSLQPADLAAAARVPGPAGAPGPSGPKGDPGPAGPLLDTLPSGRSLVGYIADKGQLVNGQGTTQTPISFPIPLAAAPSVVRVIPDGAAPPADCPGTRDNPRAAPGVLCVFIRAQDAAFTLQPFDVTRFGTELVPSNIGDTTYGFFAVWAVTAP
jgi:hypothetical protein